MTAEIVADSRANADLLHRGFTIARLLSADEATALLERMVAIRGGESFDRTDGGGTGIEFHSSFLDMDPDYRKRADELVRSSFAGRLDALLRDYEILNGGLLLKPAWSSEVNLHYDWTMIRDLDQVSLNVWCPLVDVDISNGALQLVEGSQRLVRHIGAPHAPLYCRGYEAVLKERSTPIPLRAGEAVIYDSTVLHWSSPNGSGRARPVIAMNCIPRTATPVFYRLDDETAGRRFEVFDMSGGAYYEHDAADYFAGRIRARSLGFVRNGNRVVPLAEFERRLARAKNRRDARGGATGRTPLLRRLAASLGYGGKT
jgi:hypothetical protein